MPEPRECAAAQKDFGELESRELGQPAARCGAHRNDHPIEKDGHGKIERSDVAHGLGEMVDPEVDPGDVLDIDEEVAAPIRCEREATCGEEAGARAGDTPGDRSGARGPGDTDGGAGEMARDARIARHEPVERRPKELEGTP